MPETVSSTPSAILSEAVRRLWPELQWIQNSELRGKV